MASCAKWKSSGWPGSGFISDETRTSGFLLPAGEIPVPKTLLHQHAQKNVRMGAQTDGLILLIDGHGLGGRRLGRRAHKFRIGFLHGSRTWCKSGQNFILLCGVRDDDRWRVEIIR